MKVTALNSLVVSLCLCLDSYIVGPPKIMRHPSASRKGLKLSLKVALHEVAVPRVCLRTKPWSVHGTFMSFSKVSWFGLGLLAFCLIKWPVAAMMSHYFLFFLPFPCEIWLLALLSGSGLPFLLPMPSKVGRNYLLPMPKAWLLAR